MTVTHPATVRHPQAGDPLTVDRRQSPDRRAFPVRRLSGRRLDDALPDPALVSPEHVKRDLDRLAHAAAKQQRERFYAICCAALARIEELEAEVLVMQSKRRVSGYARSQSLTPTQRQEIASNAIRARWDKRERP